MRVSILIPCFNAERWIAQAIESALAQTWPSREVIVVDDGSTDGSLEVVKSFGSNIQWETGPNRGGNAARNRLLELAGGSWVQYLDADDYLLPEKIAAQVACLSAVGDADVVFGPVTLEHWSEGKAARELLPIPEPHDPWVLLARWYLPQTGAPLWRKQAIADVGGWKIDQLRCQEHELYMRLLAAGKRFAYCPATGAVYRQWSEQTLWKSDRAKTRQVRLDIVRRAEGLLSDRGELTPDRQWAINQGRFECARSAWQERRQEARRIVEEIHRSQPDFVPAGEAATPGYRLLYRWLGFGPTEMVAGWRRQLVRAPRVA
jgi:glycosyltransferase involved in cell wall biosynthesis